MNKFIYQKDYPVVQTKEGALRGYEWKGTCIFKGIPYAHAQRFRKPERVKPWDGVKDVQSYGYVSPLLHPEQPGGNGEIGPSSTLERERQTNFYMREAMR